MLPDNAESLGVFHLLPMDIIGKLILILQWDICGLCMCSKAWRQLIHALI